ncbi:pyrroline-5-carboxylate reductase [Bacillus paralicheniformis]|uniref:pyrroline-5-carboxylate reductase n=1 Tax=Bacillus paralicheniformis TaxID=1648923 RepID=UPI00080D96FA|nr:pyrroline-5-carboxylate reductase [Bacillus paralicheniformis]TAI50508.1 pyrroline-5-carboxylate reductase [Bacillus paralicheniformis]TAI53824.1 pyrroline-5-carboxylate reductase [Bacillus paralicheniformis]
MKRMGFIGAGSMAEAMIKGLVKSGAMEPEAIFVTNQSNTARLRELSETYGVCGEADTAKVAARSDTLVLAMKPKDAAAGMAALRPYLRKDQLLISVLAGIPIHTIQHYAGLELPVVRAMPNTSAAIQKSATAFAASPLVTKEQMREAADLFATVGSVAIVEESALDAVTAVAGSGPAFVYRFVEALQASAAELGLPEETAKQLIIDMMSGAAQMLETGRNPSVMRKEITSAGGTTEAGLRVLDDHQFEQIVISCVKEAANRSAEIRDMFAAKI